MTLVDLLSRGPSRVALGDEVSPLLRVVGGLDITVLERATETLKTILGSRKIAPPARVPGRRATRPTCASLPAAASSLPSPGTSSVF
jgi:hypothetical protein